MNWLGCIEWGSMNTPEIISVDNGGQPKWNESKIKPNRYKQRSHAVSTIITQKIAVYLVISIGCSLLSKVNSCPSVCFCTWRGGKQTTECVRQNLMAIPPGINTETQVINMTGNNLQILPKEIFLRNDLLNLQKIHLVHCNLNQIDRLAFSRLKNLVELDLGYNSLTVVPSEPLVAIPGLRRLLLNNNPIKSIESKAFSILPSLVALEMSSCEINTIADGAFHGLNNLQVLKLNGNRLRTLSAAVLRDTRTVHEFLLEENLWLCDCKAREFRKYLTNPGIPYYISPRCSEPSRLNGFEMEKLSLDDFACAPTLAGVSDVPRHRNKGYVNALQVQRGGNITFECKVYADPEAFIHWLYQGRVITNSSSIIANENPTLTSETENNSDNRGIDNSGARIYMVDENNIDVDGDVSDAREKMSTLILEAIENSDAGQYTCVAENRGGRLLVNFTLDVVTLTMKQEPMVATKGFLMGVIIGLCAFAFLILSIVCVLIVRVCHQARKKRRRRLEQNKIPRSETQETKGSSSVYDLQSDTEKRDLQPNNSASNPIQKPPRSFTNATYISTSDISLHDYIAGNQPSSGKEVTSHHHHHHHFQQPQQSAEPLTIAQCHPHPPTVIFNIKPDIIKCDNDGGGDMGDYSVPSSRGVSIISTQQLGNGSGIILPNGVHDDAIYQNTGRWSKNTDSPVVNCHSCVSDEGPSSCMGVPCLHGYNGGDNSSDRSYRLATNLRPTASGIMVNQDNDEWPRVIPPPLYDTLKSRPSKASEWDTLPPPPTTEGGEGGGVRVPIIETAGPPVWEKQSPSNTGAIGATGGVVIKHRHSPGESKVSPNVYLKQNTSGNSSGGASGGLSPFPLLNLSTVRDSPDEGYEDEGEEGTEV
ncbi:LRRCT [Chamberlinius hualienensis]